MASTSHRPQNVRAARRVNTRLFAILTAIVVVLGAGSYFLRGFQMKRLSHALFERAEQLRAEGDLEQARAHLQHYIGLRPDDVNGRILLARVLEDGAIDQNDWFRLFRVLEGILRQAPEHEDLRRQQIDVALRKLAFHEERRFHEDARFHIEYLMASAPEDGELHFLLGLCDLPDFEFDQAVMHFERAIELGYHDPEVYATLADVLRRELDPPQPERADQVIEAMVQANPDSAEAYRRRGKYRSAHGLPTEALRDARQARLLDPDNPEVLLLTVELIVLAAEHDGSEQVQEARDLLEQGIQGDPDDYRLYEMSSWLELKQGNTAEAAEALRRGLHRLPAHNFMLFSLGDILIQQQAASESPDMQEIQDVIGELQRVGRWDFHISYLRAGILMDLEGRLPEARDLLLLARGQIGRLPDALKPAMLKRAGLRLADCYGRLGAYDEQITELRQVIKNDEDAQKPVSAEARRRLVAALQAVGRLDEAQEEWSRLPDSEGSLQAALLSYRQMLQRPAARRSWTALADRLPEPDPSAPDLAEWRSLRANVFHAQGEADRARRELQTLCDERPQSPDARVSLARLEIIERKWDRAREILDQAQNDFGDLPGLRLGRANYWASLAAQSADDRDQARQELSQLAQGLDQFSSENQYRILNHLAQIQLQLADREQLLELLEKQAELRPHFLPVQFELFNIALQQGRRELVEQAAERLRETEGANGHHVRMAEVMRLIDRADQAQSQPRAAELLEQARLALVRLSTQRSGWHLAAYNMGRILELQGDPDRAADQYIESIRLGNANPTVLNRAVRLLLSRERYADFHVLVQQLRDDAPALLTKDVHQAAAHVSLSMDNFRQAVQLAQAAVPEDSQSASDQIWLGQMLAVTGRHQAAEQSLRRAVELEPDNPGCWIALVRYLVRADRASDAEAVIESAQSKLPSERKYQTLGPCYELIGRLELAEEHYQASVAAAPDDGKALERASEFYLRTNRHDLAEPLLRELIDADRKFPDAQVMRARRALAVVIAGKDFPHFQEALALLDLKAGNPRDAALNQRIKSRLLTARPSAQNLRAAAELLQDLERNEVLPLEDHYYLAVIYDQLDEAQKADERWQRVLATGSQNPSYLAAYVRRLLDHERTDSAQTHIESLEALQPSGFAVYELKARLQILQGRTEPAIELLQQYVDIGSSDTKDRTDRIARVVRLLDEQFQRFAPESSARERLAEEAERWYRALLEHRPETAVDFARFLGRRGRTSEALDLCEPLLAGEHKFRVLSIGLNLALNPGTPPEHSQRVERWLTSALDQDSDSVLALIQLAEFKDNHGQYEEAETLYRKLLEKVPRHYGVMNNLAWLLSLRQGRHAEAERLIDRAIEIGGPLGALLDTRATILFNQGKTQEAIQLYAAALSQTASAATHYRLARAYAKSSDAKAAEHHWRQARQGGLKAEELHPLERTDFTQFAAAVEQQ